MQIKLFLEVLGLSDITVGIPATLMYYVHFPLWKTFFSELGCEVEISPDTNKEILDEGVRDTVTDACVPIKLYHGHVAALRDKVDYVFIPRMINVDTDKFITFCPKFLGLPDMIRASVANIPELIAPDIDRRKGGRHYLLKACQEIGSQLGKSKFLVAKAYRKAAGVQKKFENLMIKESITPVDGMNHILHGQDLPERKETDLNVAVLGYPYQIYDPYVSCNLISWLDEHKVRTWTMEMVDYDTLNGYANRLTKKMFWHFSNWVMWSSLHYMEQPEIDGIIHVTAFSCGPDAMVDKLVELECKKRGIPFLSLMIDEQTGEGGVATRLEAFTDMLRLRRDSQ